MTTFHLPETFWSARPHLSQIRDDATLHSFLSAYAELLPAGTTVSSPVGTPLAVVHPTVLVGPDPQRLADAALAGTSLLAPVREPNIKQRSVEQAARLSEGRKGELNFYVPVSAVSRPSETPFSIAPVMPFVPIDIPAGDEVADLIVQDALLRVRGQKEIDPRHAHKPTALLRAAALLRLIDGPNLPSPDLYVITLGDWELANVMYDTSYSMREFLRTPIIEQYRNRILSRVGSGTVSVSHILQGWSSPTTRTTIREIVIPALVNDGTLTLQDGRYTA